MADWRSGLHPRHGVVLLTVIIGIVLTALVAYGLRRERDAAIETASIRTQNLTRVLEEHARQSLRRIELNLVETAEELKGASEFARAGPDALRRRLRALLPADGLIRAFVVIDRDGAIVLSTLTEDVRGLPAVADRDYFVAHRERADLGMAIGAAVKSRVTGTWTLPVSVRLGAPGGAFRGVLLASVEPARLQSFYDSIDIGANGFVTLFGRRGWIVLRSPFDEGVLSRNWADSPMFRVHLPVSEVNTVRQVVAADGVERVYSYRALKDFPVIVSLGLSLTNILAPWRARAWRDGIVLLIVLAALAGAAWALSQQFKRRETAETALRESEARYRQTFELAGSGIAHVTLDGRFLRVNRKCADILGYPDTELIGLSVKQLSHPDDRDVTDDSRARIRTGELDSAHFEKRYLRKDGSSAWVDLTVALARDASGAPLHEISVMEDITERKRAEDEVQRLNANLERRVAERTAQLKTASREMESFTFSVSNDLRAPLRAIDGFSRMVLEEHAATLPPEGRRQLGLVREHTQKMAALIDGLLELVRVGRRELGLHPVKLGDFVRNCLRELRAEQEGREVELIVGELPVWNADPILLKQLFLNLLSNALKYTRKHEAPRIEIGAERRGAEQVVFVRDNGAGFDMAQADKLFGVFQRLNWQEDNPGTGVGLAIVRRVAERHGARVWAEGTPERGATFYVAFPAAAGAD